MEVEEVERRLQKWRPPPPGMEGRKRAAGTQQMEEEDERGPGKKVGPPALLQTRTWPSSNPRLFFGNGEWFLHLNDVAVRNDDILQGFVTTVCLGALHLPDNVLERGSNKVLN